jgi:hypothetical protein
MLHGTISDAAAEPAKSYAQGSSSGQARSERAQPCYPSSTLAPRAIWCPRYQPIMR